MQPKDPDELQHPTSPDDTSQEESTAAEQFEQFDAAINTPPVDVPVDMQAITAEAKRLVEDETFMNNVMQMLFKYALTRTADRDVAADIVGETLLAVIKNIGAFKALNQEGKEFDETLQGWMLGIVRYQILMHYRRIDKAGSGYGDESEALHVADPEPGPEDQLLNKSRQHIILELLDITPLSAQQRQLLELRYFQDLTTEEIAAKMNMRDGTVRAMQFRALHRLRKMWEELYGKKKD